MSPTLLCDAIVGTHASLSPRVWAGWSPFLAGSNPIEHVLDHKFEGWGGLSMQIVSLVVAASLGLLVLFAVANAMAKGSGAGNRRYVPRGRLANMIEAIILALRDQMLLPILGEKNTKRYLPLLLSLFFFILFLNLFGLVPLLDMQHLVGGWFFENPKWSIIGGTATSNIAVNAALATVAFVVIQVHSVRELGVKGFFEHLCGGHDLLGGPKGLLLLVPIMLIVELLGLVIKPAALCIRLFANMVGGHTLMATLFMFGAMAYDPGAANKAGNWALVGGVSILSGAFAVAIYFLELFVAFLQAFIFMFLTAVFIAQMSHEDHPEHDHDHEHDHGPAHAPAHAH